MMTIANKTTSNLQQFYAELLKDPMLQERALAATSPETLCELAVELGIGLMVYQSLYHFSVLHSCVTLTTLKSNRKYKHKPLTWHKLL